MSVLKSAKSAFGNRRVWLLVLLGFSSGLPFHLVQSTLVAWMTNRGVALKTIGLFAFVSTPLQVKFVWSPLMDRFGFRWLGRRRGWMVLSQLALALAFVALSFVAAVAPPLTVAALALAGCFFEASQDIAADAYRTDVLAPAERAAGTATFVVGYRIALLMAGGVALVLSDVIGWPWVYRVMAALMGIGTVTAILAPEPVGISVPKTLVDAVVRPFTDFFSRPGAVVVLIFLVLYRMSESFGSGLMLTPFLIKTGFTNTEIGTVNKIWGVIATLSGSFIAGALLPRLGLRRSLFIFGFLQAFTNAAYMGVALVGRNLGALIGAVAVHNICSGLADGAQITFMMSLCNRRFSATQYALLSSLVGVARFSSAPSGFIAEAVGWPKFFALAIILGIPALVLLALMPAEMAVPEAEPEVVPAAISS